MWSNGLSLADVRNQYRMEGGESRFRYGTIIDTSDFSWEAYGGYLADSDRRQP